MDTKLAELEGIILLLKKHGVFEFCGHGISMKLTPETKAETNVKDIIDNSKKKTSEQEAEEILFYSSR